MDPATQRRAAGLPVLILKIGGGRAINLEGVAEDLCAVQGPVVVVHGANAWRDELVLRLGGTSRVLTSASGYESVFSDDAAIDALLMAYAGLRNKRVVEALLRRGLRAVGLTGLDGGLIRGRRTRGIRSREGDKVILRRDRSGKPVSVDGALLTLLLSAGYLPVLTVPIADEAGEAINTENDEVVALLHATLRARTVVQLIEAPGLLEDPLRPETVVARLDPGRVAALEGGATGRFKRKLRGIAKLFEAGPCRLVVADGRGAHPLRDALAGRGTVVE